MELFQIFTPENGLSDLHLINEDVEDYPDDLEGERVHHGEKNYILLVLL